MSKLKEELSQKISAFPSYIKSWVKTFRGGLTLLCLIILIFLPLIVQGRRTFIRTLSLALIFCIFAASWDFLTGIAGQISFGHAIFFGIAGYLCAYFIKYQNWFANFIFLFVAMFFCLLVVVLSDLYRIVLCCCCVGFCIV